ncbi:MAG: hypothetical protein JRJ58_13395 [Deltaproteobacteria bacterium]|nr:hypothetical protein [Deltaproteobacteria bacterium]
MPSHCAGYDLTTTGAVLQEVGAPHEALGAEMLGQELDSLLRVSTRALHGLDDARRDLQVEVRNDEIRTVALCLMGLPAPHWRGIALGLGPARD